MKVQRLFPQPMTIASGVEGLQFLADQLTRSQAGIAHYAHLITTCPPGFSDLATGLQLDSELTF